jgi:NhaA family Na+:H+ antiporter
VTEALSPVERLEVALHPWAAFAIMPIFALANAGVGFSGAMITQPVTIATIAGLALGKPLGVIAASWLAVRFGLASRGAGLSWPFLMAGALLTGIGFTMSLFIASLVAAVLGTIILYPRRHDVTVPDPADGPARFVP